MLVSITFLLLVTPNKVVAIITTFQALHVSKSPFSERPQEKYDHVTICIPKVLKSATKILEIG